MKKLILSALLFCSTFFFSQKNQSYAVISYSSICCGTPTSKPVMDYLKQFEDSNRLNTFEVITQTGLGKEGEHNFYIGIDALDKGQKSKFFKGLQSVIDSQNKNRRKNSDGFVGFDPKVTVHKADLTKFKNLIISKK